MPSFVVPEPVSYLDIPREERAQRCSLGSDDCVIDEKWFFVRGIIEIPVHGHDEPFSWNVWVSLSAASYEEWVKTFDTPHRSHVGPFFGWLNARLPVYPDTFNLATSVRLRDHGIRPRIEIQPAGHPLFQEQREGISVDRVAEIYRRVVHPDHHY